MTVNEQKLAKEIHRYGEIQYDKEFTNRRGKCVRNMVIEYSGKYYDIQMVNGEYTYLKEKEV